MKLIFLDIDGVLNSIEWHKQAGNGFGFPPAKRSRCTKERLRWCPEMVQRLKWVIDSTDAKIVISSSWRGYGEMAVRKWRAMFRVYGWRNAPVIGETPYLEHKTDGGILVVQDRGDEVAAWLDAHPHVVDRYVCIDDGGDFRPDQPLVQTSMERGLTAADAVRCIALLSTVGSAPGERRQERCGRRCPDGDWSGDKAPGGMECEDCGCIFIGNDRRPLCKVCHDNRGAAR